MTPSYQIMLYFAYGSNIHPGEMECPDVTYLGNAVLNGYRLIFSRYSTKRKGGVLDIMTDEGSKVVGVLYEIGPDCEVFLDRKEGISWNYYRRIRVSIMTDDRELSDVLSYEVVDKDLSVIPSKPYAKVVLEGMNQREFPDDYIENFIQLAKLV